LPIHVELKKEKVERLRNTKIKILTVCRLEKEKDLETAIRAFKKVVLSGIVAEFTIVGDGGERGSLELLAKSLELGNKVNFVGWQKNLENYYKEADVYLSTSLYEGYGMSAVEAASFGLPAVLSDAGVARFVLRDKQEAFVCKQRDVSGFAKAIAELCFSYELRQKMGEMAKEAVEKDQISWNEYLGRYQSLLNDTLVFYGLGHGIFKKNMSVQPFQVVEVITKKNLQGESTSYVLRTFYNDKEYTEIDSKIDAEFFASAEVARTTLVLRAEASIKKIVDLATENAEKFFQLEEHLTKESIEHVIDNQLEADSSTVETIIEGKRVKVRLPKTQ
jgi:hypothetical protein